jgi:hypothetical protein
MVAVAVEEEGARVGGSMKPEPRAPSSAHPLEWLQPADPRMAVLEEMATHQDHQSAAGPSQGLRRTSCLH